MAELTPWQKAALDYSRHISLTANAGSGKTFVLAKRYVEIVLNEDISLRNIAAITFTEKAAGELNSKIALEIERRMDEEDNPLLKKRLDRARKQLVSAKISTIHSFCIDILKEFAPEAGVDANFLPADQNVSAELLELSIDEIIEKELKNEDSRDVPDLIRLFGSKFFLKEQIVSFFMKRDKLEKLPEDFYSGNYEEIAGRYIKLFEDNFDKHYSRLYSRLISLLNQINSLVLDSDPANETARLTEELLLKFDKIDSLSEQLSFLFHQIIPEITTKQGSLRKKGYSGAAGKETASEKTDELEDIFKHFRLLEYPADFEAVNKSLARFAQKLYNLYGQINEEYTKAKNQRGMLDFDDLLILSRKVLRFEHVKNSLAGQYNYIMIDEYQDTNELQYEIFKPLLDELRRGNLFVVGDEKQSIYMFRGAELEVFNRTRSDIQSQGDEEGILELPHSFRMSPAIAFFTNTIFGSLFGNADKRYNETEYNELVCARSPENIGSVEFLITNSDATEISEADLVAGRIINLLNNSDIAPGDIAVLCRKRSDFDQLERAFLSRKIPYTIIGGRGFYQRQLIYDILNYCRFLHNPDNDLALTGILRSPFFMIDDTSIYTLSLKSGRTLYEKLALSVQEDTRYSEIQRQLSEHLKFAGSGDIPALLRKILAETGYLKIISARRDAEQELANIEKLIGITINFVAQGSKTLFDYIDYLAKASETRFEEGQANVESGGGNLKIMTIHQSKGLEFKALFLYGNNSSTREETVKKGETAIDPLFGILTKVPVSSFFDDYLLPPVAGLYKYIENRKLIAEAKRLLYVAVTRAVDFLFISADTGGRSKIKKNSFFEFLISALKTDFESGDLKLSGGLKYMAGAEESFEIRSEEFEMDIAIITETDQEERYIAPVLSEPAPVKIMDNNLDEVPSGEIISAVRYSLFSSCPMKYKLTYELGYDPDLLAEKDNRPEKSSVKKNILSPEKRGSFIHKMLEYNPSPRNFDDVFDKVAGSPALPDLAEDEKNEFRESIRDVVITFLESPVYNSLMKEGDTRDEFEIYRKVNDYYLHGILDKLIVGEKEIIIVDFKTDSLENSGIEEKAKLYLPQLEFYAWLASGMFGERKITVYLLFVQEPENPVRIEIKDEHLRKTGERIGQFIRMKRTGGYEKEAGHCKECKFSRGNNECIVK